MSSFSIAISRKRSHSPDFSDSSGSEDEAPPVKLKKRGTKVPVAFSLRLKNLVTWISDLPVKDFFKMSVQTAATLPQGDIVTDEDDDVILLDEDYEEKANPFVQRLDQLRKNKLSNSQRISRQLGMNGSPRYQTRGSEVTCFYDSHYNSHKNRNGSSSGSWPPRHLGNGSYNLRTLSADKPGGIISNPPTELQVYMEASKKSSSPEPDLEIIEDSPNEKSKPISSVKPVRTSRLSTIKSVSSSVPSQSAFPKPCTAHEVVRLQEKAQYQALLDKYISGGNQYYNISKKPKSSRVKGNPKGFEFSGEHFKKEVLKQPLSSFIEKYCKPCRLVPAVQKTKEPVEIVIDDDDDDEVEVIDIKLPKYRPSYEQKPDFFSADWIHELRNTVNLQSEERLKIIHEHERALERYKKERLLERLNEEVIEPKSAKEEFPELTTEMDDCINKALTGDPEELLYRTPNKYDIQRKDVDTLFGLNWLNDQVVTCYLDLIAARSKEVESYPTVFCFNTFFYTSLKSRGYSGVARWTRGTDIFAFDINFIPMHLGVHWALGVIDYRVKRIAYYDSMGSGEEKSVELFLDYICDEAKTKKGITLDPSSFTLEVMKDIPYQMNGCDCGMFALKYAEYISRDAELTFSQKHMQYFRRRMIYELINNKLL